MTDTITVQQQMREIRDQWGATIATACGGSSVPAEFLAALIGNESGGNPNARRFEKNVLVSLWQVLLGREAAYGSITRANLLPYLTGLAAAPVTAPATVPADILQRLDGLATSWGLTQIMGYNALTEKPFMAALSDPSTNLALTVRLLGNFARRWDLAANDFAKLFACWNCGRPDPAATFDPQYVPNGLARMAAYGQNE